MLALPVIVLLKGIFLMIIFGCRLKGKEKSPALLTSEPALRCPKYRTAAFADADA